MENEDFQRKEYFQSMSLEDVRERFRIQAEMYGNLGGRVNHSNVSCVVTDQAPTAP